MQGMPEHDMSNRSKGKYYLLKTKELLESEGYMVAIAEHSTAFKTSDIFGADIIAMNGKEIVFVQVKGGITAKYTVKSALKEFDKYPFPKSVKRKAYGWLPYSKKPIIL